MAAPVRSPGHGRRPLGVGGVDPHGTRVRGSWAALTRAASLSPARRRPRDRGSRGRRPRRRPPWANRSGRWAAERQRGRGAHGLGEAHRVSRVLCLARRTSPPPMMAPGSRWCPRGRAAGGRRGRFARLSSRHVAAAAMDLDRRVGDPPHHLRAEQLRHGGRDAAVLLGDPLRGGVRASARPAMTPVCMSARSALTSWKSPIGVWPWVVTAACSSDSSSARWAEPTARPEMCTRGHGEGGHRGAVAGVLVATDRAEAGTRTPLKDADWTSMRPAEPSSRRGAPPRGRGRRPGPGTRRCRPPCRRPAGSGRR